MRRITAVWYRDVLEHYRQRLHLIDAQRMKLVRVPGNLDRPHWVEDPHIDLENHMSHLALPRRATGVSSVCWSPGFSPGP